MTINADEANPTKPQAVKEDVSETEQPKETLGVDNKTAEIDSTEDEGITEHPVELNEEAHREPEEEDLRNQLLRVMADNENLRKRTEREVAAAKKYGPVSFARDLLASLDNLEKAISLIPEDKNGMDETIKNILIGVDMTGREVAAVFERHGIEKINPEGEKFDYNLHQAMFEVPTDDVESGVVVQVVQQGYRLHDRLLRPAMVGVSKVSQDETSTSDGD